MPQENLQCYHKKHSGKNNSISLKKRIKALHNKGYGKCIPPESSQPKGVDGRGCCSHSPHFHSWVVTWLDVSPFCPILGGHYCLISHFMPATTLPIYSPYNTPFPPSPFQFLVLAQPFSIIHGIFKLGLYSSSTVWLHELHERFINGDFFGRIQRSGGEAVHVHAHRPWNWRAS